jgi:glycosyltransferase involved in cell wall biosynthesis
MRRSPRDHGSPTNDRASLLSPEVGAYRLQNVRIAHVITRLINGGADENTVTSCNQAVRSGHSVILVHGAQTRPEILSTVDARVAIVELRSLVQPIAPFSDMRALRDLVRTFRLHRPHVVHTHTSKAGILGRLAARTASVPVLVHGVHIVPFVKVGRLERYAYLTAERAVQGMTHAFIDVSPGMRDLCVKAGVGAPERHHIVPSGFDLSVFRSATVPEDWRDLLGLGSGDPRPPVVVMLAVLEARKRHLECLERIPRIVARFPETRFVFAGDGCLRNDIEARIRMLGIERNVVLTGFHPHPEQLIALADICLLASEREGLPRALMQYLAGGTPVIAADLPSIDEVLRHDVNGLIVRSDLDGLADAVIALLADNARRARLARGAETTELSKWDAAHMGERLEAVYADVMRERMPQGLPGRGEAVMS